MNTQIRRRDSVAAFNRRAHALADQARDNMLRDALAATPRVTADVRYALLRIERVTFSLDEVDKLLRHARVHIASQQYHQVTLKHVNATEARDLKVLYAEIVGAKIVEEDHLGHNTVIDWNSARTYDDVTT